MIYREAGQFKTTYQTDSAIFPILQDKLFMLALLAISFAVIPVLGSDYFLSGILIPFVRHFDSLFDSCPRCIGAKYFDRLCGAALAGLGGLYGGGRVCHL